MFKVAYLILLKMYARFILLLLFFITIIIISIILFISKFFLSFH